VSQILLAENAAMIEALVTAMLHIFENTGNYVYFHPYRVLGQLLVG
jgi:hypothetical protein